jgi:hypothetical protein
MRGRSGAPPLPSAAFPELSGTDEPAPRVRPRGSRLVKLLARVALWSLIAVGAVRGLLPAAPGPAPAAPTVPREDRQAAAVAAAFLREYLTVGDDHTARAERLARFAAAGADLGRAVSLPQGDAQYADLVAVSGTRWVDGGIEVTVLAHLLQLRSGAYRDAGTLAFTVPLAVRRQGIAVSGSPRPAALPVASGLPGSPRPRVPPEVSRTAGRMARQAVVAAIATDAATLARLGGGRMPSTRPLPRGWRATSVGSPEVTGSPTAPVALVPVRVRPPVGPASYLVPGQVQLAIGPRGPTVRRVDLGGSR